MSEGYETPLDHIELDKANVKYLYFIPDTGLFSASLNTLPDCPIHYYYLIIYGIQV